MRTKNAKRLWPVPATLAVMAVAALLAFGLMATTGAQPAAAQDIECQLTMNAAAMLDITVHDGGDLAALDCTTVGGTAMVQVNGPLIAFSAVADDRFVRVYIEDSNGALDAFAPSVVAEWDTAAERYEVDNEAASTTRYRFLKVAIPGPETNPNTGVVKRGSAIFAVQSSKGGTVHIYHPDSPLSLTQIEDADMTPDASERRGLIGASGTLTITFLGMPSLGKDSDNDRNKILDDFVQCTEGTDEDDDFNIGTTNADGIKADCAFQGDDALDTTNDSRESRSKLVGHTDEVTITHAIGGKSEVHILDATAHTSVTVFARIEDAEMHALPGTDVRFVAEFQPSANDLKVDFAADRTEDALTVLPMNGGDDPVVGESVRLTTVMQAAGIDVDDSIAFRTISGLPTDKAFRTTVNVSVGSLSLGSIVITRVDDPAVIKAGTFSIKCLDDATPATPTDYIDDKVDLTNEGCDADGTDRFGAGEKILVKAHLEDDLMNIVDGTISVKLAEGVANPLATVDEVEVEIPVTDRDVSAWVYTVSDKAMLSDHMITVSTTAKNADDEAIDDVTLTVTVAGPPISLDITGDGSVDLGGSETFTVTAEDANNGVPHFDTDGADRDDMVTVLIQPSTALVDGLNASNQVMLDPETGTAEFTVYAALDAEDGDQGRLIARLGELQDIEPITFGLVLGMPGMPMDVMAMADGHDTINVSWETPTDTGYSDITGYMVQRGYMDADNMMMWMDVDPAHMGMDMMYMDMGLMAETTYYYRVAAMNAQGMGAYSDGMAMAMTMAEDMAPDGEMLTSPSGVSAVSLGGTGAVEVSWTPGQNATRHWVVLFSLPGRDVGDRVEVLTDPDANSQVFRNVPDGPYEVLVASYHPDRGFQYQDGIGMVTVE